MKTSPQEPQGAEQAQGRRKRKGDSFQPLFQHKPFNFSTFFKSPMPILSTRNFSSCFTQNKELEVPGWETASYFRARPHTHLSCLHPSARPNPCTLFCILSFSSVSVQSSWTEPTAGPTPTSQEKNQDLCGARVLHWLQPWHLPAPRFPQMTFPPPQPSLPLNL